MARQSRQKLKLLYLVQILSAQTDEMHPMSAQQLADALALCGIPAERKSIYDDIAALQEYGMQIDRVRSGSRAGGGYFLRERLLSDTELHLLSTTVASSKFITEEKSQALIRKLMKLTNRYAAGRMERHIFLLNRKKHGNEQIYRNIDRIQEAIAERRAIRFKYYSYTVTKDKTYRRDGKPYFAVPYALCWDDDAYYMVAHYPARDTVSNFRVDRMEQLFLADEVPEDAVRARFSVKEYTQGLFSMFPGEKQLVRIVFAEPLLNAVFDRFGREIAVESMEGGRFAVVTDVVVSPAFWGWLFQFGDSAYIESPQALREEAEARLRALAARYGERGDGAEVSSI